MSGDASERSRGPVTAPRDERFTMEQYASAINHLADAQLQLVPDGRSCACCGDSGHQAFECGHNPLVAMQMCKMITERALELHAETHEVSEQIKSGTYESRAALLQVYLDAVHEFLHSLAGYNHHLGMQTGPARVVLPPAAGHPLGDLEER